MNDRAQARQPDLFEAESEDDDARRRALDIGRSFLVQAPAGSGKTELLIQRCLALLATVDEPERIVALTFTRKAAGEMRERVLRALIAARDQAPPASHERTTRKLADAVLEQDGRRGWNLIAHASRLRLETFDALVVGLAARAPLASGLGPQPVYVDDARPLYRAASQAAIAAAPADDPAWRSLLAHLGNDAARAVSLIAHLLQHRAEWLRQITGEDPARMRNATEDALQAEVAEVLATVREGFPAGAAATLAQCARHAASVLADRDGAAEQTEGLMRLAADGGLPPAHVDALPQWRALRRLLLTKEGRFRQTFQSADGFLPKSVGPAAQRNEACKDALKLLCRSLDPELGESLAAAARLPRRVDDESWQIVLALLGASREAVGQLELAFRESGKVDFVSGNLAAMRALGSDDEPSDLLQRLDARIDHLLIDEFQDTSLAQLDLVTRLTEGWQPGDGRTLFAVGDPMQSIYRFREAEVRLFVDAQRLCRIGNVPVEPLRLRRNFRSQRNLVDWVNTHFPLVLGDRSDAPRGAVAFTPATPDCPAAEGIAPTVELVSSLASEAEAVVARIREARARGASDIAVLVRARNHLAAVLPALRRAGVSFTAVDLDRLSERQAIRDLAALTHALVQPDDRTAWLAVLRAPWCGLCLPDLLALTEAAGRRPLPSLLDQSAPIANLSADGQARLARALAALAPALAARGRQSVTARVRGAWLALGGAQCLDDPLDLDTAECFFALLSEHESGGDIADWDAFLVALAELPASPSTPGAGDVQVMTMHRAKGLEFDTVILPGLAAWTGHDEPPLMRWRRREKGLLIAPGKSKSGVEDPLYAYLGELDKKEQSAELGRLLYVACTRAKTRLHLIAAPAIRPDRNGSAREWNPPSASSLAKLWPAIGQAQALPTQAPPAPDREGIAPPPLFRRPLDAMLPEPREALELAPFAVRPEPVSPPFEWAAEAARQIGTLAHRLLAQLASAGVDRFTPQRMESLEPRVRASLASAGFAESELPAASARVMDAVRRTLADPRGRWLFDPTHEDARSEWALAGVDDGEVVHVVVDRTFVTGGERWIVDFKTGVHEGGDVGGFLDREALRYRDQLARYGRVLRGLDARPVRLALYYPLIEAGFREIEP